MRPPAMPRRSVAMVLLLLASPSPDLPLLGAAHFAILGGVVALGALLAVAQHAWAHGSRGLSVGVGLVLLADTAAWYAYQIWIQQPIFPRNLPLELCDFTLFLTIAVLLWRSALLFDLVYYWALAGTSMALLTPDLWEQFPSLATCQFFFAHGLVVAAVLYLVWSGEMRPRPGSVRQAMIGVNVCAVFDGAFNATFHTNYMYLAQKPQNASLLSVLGRWPWYIAGAELVALALFLLLYLPFRRGRNARAVQ